MSIILLLIVLVINAINLINSELVIRNCGPSDSYSRMGAIKINPYPIKYPGTVDIDIDVNIIKDVPSQDLIAVLSLDKLTPNRMHIPCMDQIGSCTYDYCEQQKVWKKDSNLFGAMMPIDCPVNTKNYTFHFTDRTLPNVPDIFKKVIDGQSEVNMSYVNSKTGQVYGCVYAKFDVKVLDL
ncbi:uncharacterized protein LOC128958543 [Oppia nitens]|uniref:uncharacterized protein LOC128958543 n=1 Tax=Oppia nitens TaxID=1686743 RepID=UPI0023DC3C05|nr:uncharacterized protein LOC128958543 [Oppia nitens]